MTKNFKQPGNYANLHVFTLFTPWGRGSQVQAAQWPAPQIGSGRNAMVCNKSSDIRLKVVETGVHQVEATHSDYEAKTPMIWSSEHGTHPPPLLS